MQIYNRFDHNQHFTINISSEILRKPSSLTSQNMTPEEFAAYISQLSAEAEAVIKNIRMDIGKMAVDHFTENFQVEGFVNSTTEPWKDVKRRTDPRVRGARSTRKILTGDTGNLGRSITYKVGPGENQVTIFSDIPYASAHNEGTSTAGRGRHTTIPKRQFIGRSQKLDEKIQKEIEDGLREILNG